MKTLIEIWSKDYNQTLIFEKEYSEKLQEEIHQIFTDSLNTQSFIFFKTLESMIIIPYEILKYAIIIIRPYKK